MMASRFIRDRLQVIVVCLFGLAATSQAQLLPPIITVQPLSTTAQNGGRAAFSVTVTSLTTPSFAWLFNGQPVSPANTSVTNYYALGVGTISTLTISNVIPANAGSFSVQVSNGAGSPVTSLGAILSVVGGILVDHVTGTNSGSAGAADLVWPHTVGIGANGLLVVTVTTHSGYPVSSVTYGGAALTHIGTVTNASGSHVSAELWVLKSPPAGTTNIAVTLSETDTFTAAAASFFGVNQAQPFNSFTAATGAADSPEVTIASSAGQVVLDAVAVNAAVSGTAGNGQFPLWEQFTGSSTGDVWGSGSMAPGAHAVTMSWTMSGSGAGEWASAALALNPAGNIPLLSPPPTVTSLASTGFTVQLSAPVGSTVVIEASSNMIHWIPISTNAAPTGWVSYTDTAATNLAWRYYRAMVP